MSRIVKVRNVKIGNGIPKICIPITDTDFDGVKKSVRLIENSPHDIKILPIRKSVSNP